MFLSVFVIFHPPCVVMAVVKKKQNSVSDDVLCKLSLGDGKFLMFVLFLTLY